MTGLEWVLRSAQDEGNLRHRWRPNRRDKVDRTVTRRMHITSTMALAYANPLAQLHGVSYVWEQGKTQVFGRQSNTNNYANLMRELHRCYDRTQIEPIATEAWFYLGQHKRFCKSDEDEFYRCDLLMVQHMVAEHFPSLRHRRGRAPLPGEPEILLYRQVGNLILGGTAFPLALEHQVG